MTEYQDPGIAADGSATGATGRRVAVLIPCHNEAATIATVVADFRRYLPSAQIYVYDNA